MTKKADRERIAALVEHWRARFFLGAYDINLIFADEDSDDEARASIRCEFADQYHAPQMTIYPYFFEQSAADQELAIVHELTHIPVEIMSGLVTQQRAGTMVTPQAQDAAEERVTDWLARIILSASREV